MTENSPLIKLKHRRLLISLRIGSYDLNTNASFYFLLASRLAAGKVYIV